MTRSDFAVCSQFPLFPIKIGLPRTRARAHVYILISNRNNGNMGTVGKGREVLESWEFGDPADVAARREMNGMASEAKAREAAREREEIQRTRQRMRAAVFGKAGAA